MAPPEAHSMQMVGPWGRYLPQWLRAPVNTHTHTLDLTHHNVCFRDPIRYTCQLCIPNTHMHAGPYTYSLYISQKDTQLRVKDSTHNVHPYAQVRYTSHLQSSYAVMRQLLFSNHAYNEFFHYTIPKTF